MTAVRRYVHDPSKMVDVVIAALAIDGHFHISLPDGTVLGTATHYETSISHKRGPKMRHRYKRRMFWKGRSPSGSEFRFRTSRADIIRDLLQAAGR